MTESTSVGSAVPTALDFPNCRACQMWRDAGAAWPRPCKQHYGGEPAATWHWTAEQVAWAIDHNSDAAVRATRVLLAHAAQCTVTRCRTCRAITEATSDD